MQYLIDAFSNNHEWIIVDNSLLKLMGFAYAKDIDNKKKYQKILTDNIDHDHFETITRVDSRSKVSNGKDRTMIAIKPMQFIEALKLIDTDEANTILQNIQQQEFSTEPKPDSNEQVMVEPLPEEDTSAIVTYNHISVQLNDEPSDILNIYDFVMKFKYDIDKLYIDKFWNGINDDTWIVIDKDLLKWIGYNCSAEASNKKLYYNILQNNFTKYEDFDIILTPTQFDDRVKCPIKTKNTIIVHTRAFEMSLMMVRTKKAMTIRKYFQTLGRIMKDYLLYTKLINEHNLRIENEQWKHEALEYKRIADNNQSDTFDINLHPLVPSEYVYILTSNRYYRKSIFKIGKSIKPDKRIISHNTTAATDDDIQFYTHVIPTLDCGALEKTLHALLIRYHHSKEWYKLPHAHLLDIINTVIKQQNELIDIVNTQLSSDNFNCTDPIPIDEFTDKHQNTAKYNKSSKQDSPNHIKNNKSISDPPQIKKSVQKKNTYTAAALVRQGLLFHCPICDEKFAWRSKTTEHIAAHHK